MNLDYLVLRVERLNYDEADIGLINDMFRWYSLNRLADCCIRRWSRILAGDKSRTFFIVVVVRGDQ
jgi:hypothetical protein